MVPASQFATDLANTALDGGLELNFELPDPEDEQIPDAEFQHRIEAAW